MAQEGDHGAVLGIHVVVVAIGVADRGASRNEERERRKGWKPRQMSILFLGSEAHHVVVGP